MQALILFTLAIFVLKFHVIFQLDLFMPDFQHLYVTWRHLSSFNRIVYIGLYFKRIGDFKQHFISSIILIETFSNLRIISTGLMTNNSYWNHVVQHQRTFKKMQSV